MFTEEKTSREQEMLIERQWKVQSMGSLYI